MIRGALLLVLLLGAEETTALRVGKILPVSGDAIEGGTIIIEGGKITALGKDVEIPEGARLIDRAEGVAIPGLVAAYTTLAEGGADTRESVNPEVLAVDGFDFFARRMEILSGGVTAAYVSPGKARLLSGQGAVVRLAGGPLGDRVLRPAVGVQVNLGESPKSPPPIFDPPVPPSPTDPIEPARRQLPSSRLGAFYLLRQALDREDEPMASVREGETPLLVRCHAARDISRVLEIAAAKDLRVVIQGGAESARVAERLAGAGAAVILESPLWPGAAAPEYTLPDPEEGMGRERTAAILARAGVPIALVPPSDPELPDLLIMAARAHAAGLDRDEALRAITLGPARILGVEDRIGSLEVGKDADVVILSGDPMETRSLPEMVIAGGEIVFERRARPRPLGTGVGKGWTAIRAGRILTVSQGEIRDGVILMEGGKIRAVGKQVPLPEEAEIVDASDSVVIPGLVDMQSRLGLPEDEARGVRKGGKSLGGPAGGNVQVSRALVLEDPAFRRALEAGITTTVIPPGGGGFLGGQAVAVKCGGSDLEARIVRDPAGIRFNVVGGSGSIATPWSLRSQLERIRNYAAKRKGEKPPPADESMEPLVPLLEGEIPAFVRVSTPEEILATLDVFVKEFKIRTVLVGAEKAHVVAREIRDSGVSVATGPEVRRREEGEWIHLPLRLAETGVPIAFQSSGATGSASLPMAAAYAVRHGLDEATALKALTLWPAQMARIDDRVGSIDVGKDADLVILSGDPMDLGARIQKVYLQGELVHEE